MSSIAGLDWKVGTKFLHLREIVNTFTGYTTNLKTVVLARLCGREESVVNQHNLFRKMYYSNETTCFGL